MSSNALKEGIGGLNIQYKNEFDEKQNDVEYKKMLALRQKLPTYKVKDEILKTIEENQKIVISGETGCGKTTQVVQYILDDAIEKGKGSQVKIICTQPRRISTIAVAERVAAERVENIGESVGYQIRFRKVPPRDYGCISFCTTGILLQYMLNDPALRDYSHILLDEIHERTVESDFIMGLLKQLVTQRSDLKIVMMSATLDAPNFSKYYNNCPTISIPGFIYPVKVYYIEDVINLTNCRLRVDDQYQISKEESQFFTTKMQLQLSQWSKWNIYPSRVIDELKNPGYNELNFDIIFNLLLYICENKSPGAILVFLPGLQDIKKMKHLLRRSAFFSSQNYQIYSLHSQLSIDRQKTIFQTPPSKVRKIILATSIAETSVTIEDVVYVIDSGKAKILRFDANLNLKVLGTEWESVANAKQRRGRAGRIQPGECYHLFAKIRESTLPEFITPEIKRTPLEEIILQIKMLELGQATNFLKFLLDPPDNKTIDLSLQLLRSQNIIDSSVDREVLTPLGKHLGRLPVELKLGKMILLASIFSCIEPVFAIAAGLSFENPFYAPMDNETSALARRIEFASSQYSDHIAISNVVEGFEKLTNYDEKERYCEQNYVRFDTLEGIVELKRQWAEYLHEMKFLSSDDPKDLAANRNSRNVALIKAIVCAGLFPNIARIEYKNSKKYGQYPVLETWEDGEVKIFPPTINGKVKTFATSYVAYFFKQKTTRIFLHDTTCVTKESMTFSLPKNSISFDHAVIALNKRYQFFRLDNVQSDFLEMVNEMNGILEQKFINPSTIKWNSEEGRILQVVIDYITDADPAS